MLTFIYLLLLSRSERICLPLFGRYFLRSCLLYPFLDSRFGLSERKRLRNFDLCSCFTPCAIHIAHCLEFAEHGLSHFGSVLWVHIYSFSSILTLTTKYIKLGVKLVYKHRGRLYSALLHPVHIHTHTP